MTDINSKQKILFWIKIYTSLSGSSDLYSHDQKVGSPKLKNCLVKQVNDEWTEHYNPEALLHLILQVNCVESK